MYHILSSVPSVWEGVAQYAQTISHRPLSVISLHFRTHIQEYLLDLRGDAAPQLYSYLLMLRPTGQVSIDKSTLLVGLKNVITRQDVMFISTTVILCTIVLPVFFSSSASIDRALITHEPIELDTGRFHRNICLITPSNLFRSNIIVWALNLQQTLKRKFCY